MAIALSSASFPSTDSELLRFVVGEGNGVKGLADSGISSLPPRYVHPPCERIDAAKAIDPAPYLGSSPIDLSALLEETGATTAVGDVEEALRSAAEKLGFFQVVNHGVSLEAMERAKRAAHAFFGLPAERKAAFLKERTPCRNVFYGTSFSSETEKQLEWKDYLVMMFVDDEEAMRFWPRECRDAAIDYMKSANRMIQAILGTLLRGLGAAHIDEPTIARYMEAKAVNMNYYPKCPSPEFTVGAGRHSDLAALTIPLQDDVGGLFVKVEEGIDGWIEIPPLDGALVINVGDTLEILSNGRYKSAEHRVLASSTKARVSVPIFVAPRPHTMIGPLEGLPEKDGKRVYREILFGDYMDYYFGAVHQGKRTIDFARNKI